MLKLHKAEMESVMLRRVGKSLLLPLRGIRNNCSLEKLKRVRMWKEVCLKKASLISEQKQVVKGNVLVWGLVV